MTQVAIVAPDDWTVWLFYRQLISALQVKGAEITAMTARGPYVQRLEDMGVKHVAVPYARFVSPIDDLRLYRALHREFVRHKFDIVQNITIKANIHGALAASNAGVGNIINTVEGAGLLYSDAPSQRVKAIRAIAEVGLKRARKRVTQYWFVNSRDRDLFVRRGLADENRTVVAIATGVDTAQFDRAAFDRHAIDEVMNELGVTRVRPIVVNVAGRLLRSKGIAEFVECARLVRARGVDAQFVLVGPEEPSNPDAMDVSPVLKAEQEGILRWIRFREDIAQVYALATIAVVPSYYAEGTPKGILEGMSTGIPVIGADIPSIRALVSPGENAVLVAPRNGRAIADAVCALLKNPELCDRIGNAARTKAVAEFDATKVAALGVEKVYGQLPAWISRHDG
jgi:glycosyltransferase involved in cell wall biosynthesis